MTMWPDAYVQHLQNDNARLREEIVAVVSSPDDILDQMFSLGPSLRSRLGAAISQPPTNPPKTQDEKINFRKDWDARYSAGQERQG